MLEDQVAEMHGMHRKLSLQEMHTHREIWQSCSSASAIVNELVLGADEVDFLISRDLLVVGRFLLVSQLDHQNSWPALLQHISHHFTVDGRSPLSLPTIQPPILLRSIDYDTPRPIVR